MRLLYITTAVFTLAAGPVSGETGTSAAPAEKPVSPYAKWQRGPMKDPGFFPIAVWLQDPANAKRFEALGFNLYVGLWKGPTTRQLAALKSAGMPVIC